MNYFRHIGLVTPVVKVLFCFVAGIGFEWLFDTPDPQGATKRWVTGVACAMLLACSVWLARSLARSGPALGEFVSTWSSALLYGYTHEMLVRRLESSAIILRMAGTVIAVVPALLAFRSFGGTPRARRALQYAVLAFVAADVYHFKFTYLFDHSDVIQLPARFVTRPSPLTYQKRRHVDLQEASLAGAYPRLQAALAFSPMLRQRLEGHGARQAEYWSNNAFVFADEAGSSFRVDSWLKPLDQFMRANWRLPINDTTDLPAFIDLDRVRFPLDHPGTRRVVGVDADKIRFFAHGYQVPSVDALVPLMMDPAYAGNLLFVLPVDAAETTPPIPWTSQVPLDADESRPLAYEVRQFDSNHLSISVSNAGPQPVWLSYADIWHPFWQATVNGRRVPVYQGEMAYKAVPLSPGDNVVQFRFHTPFFSILSACVAADAALWLCMICWMIMRGNLES